MTSGLPQAGSPAELLELGDRDFDRLAYESGWTDGLPVVQPTRERVEAMLAATPGDPLAVLGAMPPGGGIATVEVVAVNAVMAGCEPEHFPVVLAAVRAVLDDGFNLYGLQATTNPVAPLLMVNGPAVAELGFNAGHNCLGQGNRANAVVGRALRLCLTNVGLAAPGESDMATMGFPGKYGFCFAENEAESPWQPFHVERGFEPGQSCVSAFQAAACLNVLDAGSRTAESLLTTIAHSMTPLGTNNIQIALGECLVVLSPEHAEIVAREGLSKDDVKRFLAQNARVPGSAFSEGVRSYMLNWRSHEFRFLRDDTWVPVVERWEHVLVVVAGGSGPHSMFIPGFGDGWAVCREIG